MRLSALRSTRLNSRRITPVKNHLRTQAAFLLVLCLSCFGSVSAWSAQAPAFSENQSKTTVEIVDKLSTRHYRNLPLDDQLSSQYFDQLLDSLDPAKSYLLASDIAEFEKLRTEMDDLLRNGNLEPGFMIFSRYNNRAEDRLNWIIGRLADKDFLFDFSKKESLNIDTEQLSWPENEKAADELWRKRLKSNVLSLKLSGKTEAEAKETLHRRYGNQLKRLQQQDSEDIFEALINALTLLYDPHTNYLSPRTRENFNISMSLSLEGIGAVLQTEDEHTKVVRLITAGPADKQGMLKPADRIVAVGQGDDGELVDVVGWRLDEVVELIRGPKNTVVRLTVIPSDAVDDSINKTIRINRGKVKLEEQAAKKAVIELTDGEDVFKLGVIHVPAFYIDFAAYRRGDPDFKSTTRDVFNLLSELEQEGIDGLILDLRNNGGGSLQEATTLTDLFIDPGPVVQIRQANQPISRHSRSRKPALYRGPMVVLINRLSASASEIFAGAIQDYQRGLIIGSQSFGKGTVQSLTPVYEGELKITESKFYRVSGDSTQHRGVVPDIELPSLVDPADVGESTYDNALPWDQIHEVPHEKYYDFSGFIHELKQRHQTRADKDPDLIYLVDQVKSLSVLKDKKQISLNEKQRLAEQKSLEDKNLELANKRRVGKGQEPFGDLQALKDDSKEVAEEQGARDQDTIDVDNDPLLQESGYILLDYMKLMSNKKSQQVANF
jgi:carboxyl-terminal processing protease